MWDGSKSEGFVLRIKCQVALKDAYIGCSIAVNGTCLTATAFDNTAFEANCAPETLRRTDLVDLKPGDLVNLERSMAASDRNSGHVVQGHVDEAGTILDKTFEGDCLWVKISLSRELLPYVVPKGYIAVDGTSLTVCEVNREEQWFNLMLIAHTQKCIVVPKKNIGERVNLEADAMGKYALSAVRGVDAQLKVVEARLAKTQLLAGVALCVAATASAGFLRRCV